MAMARGFGRHEHHGVDGVASRLALGVAAALLFVGGRAQAQETSVHATGTVIGAWTDNMMGVPEPDPDSPDPQVGPISTVFIQLIPGVALFHDTARARLLVTYAHPFTIYPEYFESSTDGDVGTVQGIFSLSPRDELILGLGVTRTTANLAALSYAAGQGTAGLEPLGASTLLGIDLSQGYTRELSLRWALHQTAGAGTVIPIDTPEAEPYRYYARTGGDVEYTIGRNAFAVLADVTYVIHTALEDEADQVVQPIERQILWSGGGRWRHDLSETWSTELGAGCTFATDLDGNFGVFPTWGGAVRFLDEGYEAELSYTRAVAPNLMVGQVFYSDTVRLSGAVPISAEEHIIATSSVGFSYNQVIDNDVEVSESALAFVGDVGVGWFPDELPSIQARYQHYNQFEADEGVTNLYNFQRNLVMLTVSYMWPPRDIPDVPTGPPRRVDGTDRDPTAPGGGSSDPVRLPSPDADRRPADQ